MVTLLALQLPNIYLARNILLKVSNDHYNDRVEHSFYNCVQL